MGEHNLGIWTSDSYDVRVGFEITAGCEYTIVAIASKLLLTLQ
jgi:hypothetical protein